MSLNKKRPLATLYFAYRIIQRDFPLRAYVAPNVGDPFMGAHSFSSVNALYLHAVRHPNLLTGIVNHTGAIRITKSCGKPNRHDLGPGCKDLGGSRTRCALGFRLKLVAGQPGPLSTKPSPSFGLAPGRLAEPAMRDFLIATINPIEMSKTESAKFTRRSRPELIAR